jgi:hypothetical protein
MLPQRAQLDGHHSFIAENQSLAQWCLAKIDAFLMPNLAPATAILVQP